MRPLLLLFLLALPVLAEPFAPDLYPFRNGVKFGSIEDGVKQVKTLGYPGIGSIYTNDLPAFKSACDKEGLKVYSIYAGSKVNADSFSYDKQLPEVIKLLKDTDALIELNIQRGKNPNDEQAVALLKEVGKLAKDANLKVVIYPHVNFHVEKVDHAVKLAKASGLDNVGVTFNLCHFLKVEPKNDLRQSLELAQPYLWSASTCGADKDGNNWNVLIQPLDQGSFDQTAFLKHLRDLNFKGPIGLQCYNIKIPPAENLKRSRQAWLKHLAASQK